MRILFPIYRFNWYRTLAPVVDEALRRGHEVVCLHNHSPGNYRSNQPSERMFPRFRHGSPEVLIYRTERELDYQMVRDHSPFDAIVSIDLPLRRWLDGEAWKKRTARYCAVTTTDTLKRLYDRTAVESVDLFAVRSEWERESTVLNHTENLSSLAERARKAGRDGGLTLSFVEPRLGREWDSATVAEFRSRCRICGYPLLDAAALIDSRTVRERWGLDPAQPVVGLWSTSAAGRGPMADWDHLFGERRWWRFRAKSIRAYGWDGRRHPFINEEKVVRAVREFAHRNGALLLVKLRHYQDADTVFGRLADAVVKEDSFYPHSALELAAVSDLMVGAGTSGTPEAVWMGSPVLDWVTPGSQRELRNEALRFGEGMWDWPGVVHSVSGEGLPEMLAEQTLDFFRLNEAARHDYQLRYCGPTGGGFAANVVDALEDSFAPSGQSGDRALSEGPTG